MVTQLIPLLNAVNESINYCNLGTQSKLFEVFSMQFLFINAFCGNLNTKSIMTILKQISFKVVHVHRVKKLINFF